MSTCLLLVLLSATSLASEPGADAPGQVYIDASTGLDYPDMENGRTEIEMADVNQDGHVDLVMVGDHGSPWFGTDQHGVTVWFGSGDGAWTQGQYGEFGYGGVALGDVNGDGFVDVGFGIHHDYSGDDLGDQILEVALGNGTGTFWTAWDDGLAANGEGYGMFGSDFADVEGDGDLDIGAISFGCCAGVHVYLNNGDGTWAQSYGFLNGNSSQEFVFGEIDGDGWPDIACSHSHGTVHLNDGNGGFVVADEGLPPTSSFEFLQGISLGDANGDGRDDLAWVNQDGGIEVWTRTAAGVWTDIGGVLPETGDWSATQLWDMDGDGIVDVAAFGHGQGSTWKGDGSGGWTPLGSFTTNPPGYYSAFRVGGDIDHNGYPDIGVVSWVGQNVPQCLRESTVPATLRARIERPPPGMALRSGSVAFIHWAAEIPTTDPAFVDLEYSVDGVAGPWHAVGTGLPNNGRHQWTVPDVAGASDFRLRATVHTPTPGSASAVSAGSMPVLFGSDTMELSFVGRDTLSWTDRSPGRSVYNLYRGDWDAFLGTGDYTQAPGGAAGRWCGLVQTSHEDVYLPGEGEMVFYLVTGMTSNLEGSLGTGPGGTERQNDDSCEWLACGNPDPRESPGGPGNPSPNGFGG